MRKSGHIVIMAGGIGSRFWPLSTQEYPKQFIDILGCGRTLLQLTVDRFKGVCPEENFWVVTNERFVDIVKQQIPSIPESHILAEPAARNTAPCVAWACWRVRQEDPQANVVVTPSDAYVLDPVEYRRVICNALDFAASQPSIVTIGIRPNRPETGYGYIQTPAGTQATAAAETIATAAAAAQEVASATSCQDIASATSEILSVLAFKEKPCREVAQQYLEQGNYLWNAGIFVFNVNTMIDAITEYKPGIAALMDRIVAGESALELFPQCEKVSIDYAVMEPSGARGLVFTHPADFGWSDLGNWHSLHEKLTKDENNNAAVGNVHFYDSANNVVHAEDARKVILQGLDGYIVSVKDGCILVCKRSEEQRIKDFSLELK